MDDEAVTQKVMRNSQDHIEGKYNAVGKMKVQEADCLNLDPMSVFIIKLFNSSVPQFTW